MNEHDPGRVPKTILIATDLSARCDRALDRAIALSQSWQSKLIILHVLEDVAASAAGSASVVPSWRRPPDPVEVARRQLTADIGDLADVATVLIGKGDPAEVILSTAESRDCDLVVTGTAKDELLGRVILGTTVDTLLRRSQLPVLVVKNRVRHPYYRIVVATDFSSASGYALEIAARYFPEQPLDIFHAYDAPGSGLLSDAAAYRRGHRDIAERDYDAFLRSVPSGESIRGRAHPLIEFGEPGRLLREYTRDVGMDLVVLGRRRRGAAFELLVGSVAGQIVWEVSCDAMVIPERSPGASPGQ
jgi:nucleotide-binding universal stress UspA family protein